MSNSTITNYSTAIMLFNKNIKVVKVSYDPLPSSPVVAPPPYPFPAPKVAYHEKSLTAYKTLDASLKVGDYVIVPTNSRHNMTVCKVEEIDVVVDLESNTKIGWLVGKVDRQDYDKSIQVEEEWINVMKASAVKKKHDELKESMMAYCKDIDTSELGISKLAASNSLQISSNE